MNCRNFENNIRASLRNQLTESAAREQFSNHAENCRKCAAILEAEKNLAAAFRDVLDDISPEAVPPRIEANLLAVFNSQNARPAAAAAPSGIKNISNPIRHRRQTGWAFAAAAVIVFVCLVGIRQTGLIFSGQNHEISRASVIAVMPPDLSFPNFDEPVSDAPIQVYKKTNTGKQKTPRKDKAVADSSPRMKRGGVVKKSVTPAAQEEARFFPLGAADEFIPLESGQLVRVEVSVSSLVKLGIPVKAERGNQSVQADLLLGQDGIARAIRPLE